MSPTQTISLSALGNWLLCLADEDTSAPPLRLDHNRYGNNVYRLLLKEQSFTPLNRCNQ
jgi:hypothetical protein